MFKDLLKKTRSYRNFVPEVGYTADDIKYLIELCRYTPSTANRQALKFAYAYKKEDCDKIFPLLGWAGYLDEKPPYDKQNPTAYIVICGDSEIMENMPEVDVGICAQTIVLGAMENGIGACMIGSFSKEKMKKLFNLGENITPRLVIALGAPNEKIVLTDVKDGDIKYYRDEQRTHYVPKRTLSEIILPEIED